MKQRVFSLFGVALVLSTFLPGAGSPSVSAQDQVGLEIVGSGAWTVNNQMNEWKTALYYSQRAMDLSYIAKGDRDGRQIFARGDADFVVSGLPLNAEDTAKLADRKVSVIDAPISVASIALLWSGPYPSGLRTFTPDPVDPEESGTFAPYNGVLRLPNSTIAKIWIDRQVNNWYDADFIAANTPLLPAGSTLAPVINPTLPLVRSDPSAENFYMQQLTRKFDGPGFLQKVAEEGLKPFDSSESWPFLNTGSRSGSGNTANLVAGWQNPKAGSVPDGGVITATPLSDALYQRDAFPTTPLFIPEIQNAANEWIAPTSASISLGIDKGDGAPLAALNTPIPGAYPLSWVNRVYVRASGLDIEKTNGLATMIRYAVTVGQNASEKVGEGRLSEKLVSEALSKADQIVSGNCVGSDRKVVAAVDGGPLWPTGVTMPVGSFTVCTAVTNPGKDTTTAPGSAAVKVADKTATNPFPSSPGSVLSRGSSVGVSSGSVSSGSSYSGSLDDLSGTDAVSVVDSVSPSSDLASSGSAPKPSLVSASLPMGMPDDGRGELDRLSTMVLGGIAILLARGFFKRSKVTT